MIVYDEKNQIFKIDTENTSYVIGLADGKFPGQVYYGRRLLDTNLFYLLRTWENPCTPAIKRREEVGFFGCYPMEYPAAGTGDYRECCLDTENAKGQRGCMPVYESHRVYAGKPSLPGLPSTWGESAETLELHLRDEVLQMSVYLSYTVFEGIDAVIKSSRIVNEGERFVKLQRALSSSLSVDRDDLEVMTLPGSWAREKEIVRQRLLYTQIRSESKRGISSHQAHPFLALLSSDCTQNSGEIYGMNLVYSGNFLAAAELDQFGMTRAVLGIHPDLFTWRLDPGDTFVTPEAVLVYSDRGIGGMTRTYHDLYRNHLIRGPWRDKARPVLINNWEATYFDFDEERILQIALEAAERGIEMMVLDDGWFGHRDTDEGSLGDWDLVDRRKLPAGLSHLAEKIHGMGMKFGLWMEPEMISRDSELYRSHPDYVLAAEGREAGECRAQLVLDLTREDVRDTVYEKISHILHTVPIDYVKWDMNRPLSDLGTICLSADRQGEISHRYMLGVYNLQERLCREFPELLLENCCSGGGRFDPGMLYYSPQIWTSDNTDPIARLGIQEATAMLYPLSSMGAHIGAFRNPNTGRVVPAETAAAVAMAGTFGYELDVCKLDEAEKAKIPAQVGRYKKYQRLIAAGDYYRITSAASGEDMDSWMIVSKDQREAILTCVQVLHTANRRSRRLCLPGLKNEVAYRCDFLDNEREQVLPGDTLMQAGILIDRKWGDFQVQQVYLKEC